jgi:Glycosyltransferase Family 4/Glycosyl transferases group 1
LKIAYICYVSAFTGDGVNDKIATQVGLWEQAGHDVRLLCLWRAPDNGPERPMLPGAIFTFRTPSERVRATIALARTARRLSPDIVYLRYDRFVPPLAPLLWPLPVAVEINTDDRVEFAFYGRAGWLYNELNREATLRAAAGLVSVTHELARSSAFSRYRKPTIVVANGGDSANISAVPPANNARPEAVMLIGALPLASWVGADKIVALARALPELTVHLVGAGSAQALDARAGSASRLPTNIVIHGALTRDEYRNLLARADFGIGPLALHRKGMSEAAPLKTREYLLHGLPVLMAHHDTDFLGEEPWFLLRLPNSEDNVATSLPAIRAWAASIRGRRVPRDAVVARLSSEGKEGARLAFLAQLARGARRTSAASPAR